MRNHDIDDEDEGRALRPWRGQPARDERERALAWRGRYGGERGYGASSGYGAWVGSGRSGVQTGWGGFGNLGPPPGPYYGKGPKGYRRSDARILDDVGELVAEQSDVDASDVEVVVKDGVVTLRGTVERRGDKRILEALVENVLGVVDVVNELRARRDARFTHLGGTGPNAATQWSERSPRR